LMRKRLSILRGVLCVATPGRYPKLLGCAARLL
jgi:hypothetical protein